MTTVEPLPTIRKYREGLLDFETMTLRVALFDDSVAYTHDRVNYEFVSDVLNGTDANELDDASYSRKDVTNPSVTVDGTDVEVVIDADDARWTDLAGGETIQGWLLYHQVGGDDTTPGDDPIIAIEDEVKDSSGNAVTTDGSDVVLEFAGEGIINVA